MKNPVDRFGSDRRGSVAIVFAVCLIPLLLVVGLAIDVGRAYIVENRLAAALDAAALAVGADPSTDKAYLESKASEFFNANYASGELGTPTGTTVSMTDSTVMVSGTAEVETLFLNIAGWETIPVAAEAEVVRRTTGLEVVLVLDVTGSMAGGGKIDALRDSAEEMVNILFSGKDKVPSLKVSVVPFAVGVNIGAGRRTLVENFDEHADFGQYGTDWKGCVQARPHPHDVSDTDGATAGKWTRFRWPIEPGPNSGCPNPAATGKGADYDRIDEVPSPTYGPNKACGEPISGFSSDRAALLDKIRGLEPWNHGGTMTHLGLAWGMRMISPEPPLTAASNYSDDDWAKAVIVMTDGQNQLWLGDNPQSCMDDGGPEGPYSPYGYVLSNERLGVDDTMGSRNDRNALINDELDDRMSEVCDAIKGKASGRDAVSLYTVTFKVGDQSTKDLFKACASEADNYYNSPSNDELRSAFRAIGAELKNLRISR